MKLYTYNNLGIYTETVDAIILENGNPYIPAMATTVPIDDNVERGMVLVFDEQKYEWVKKYYYDEKFYNKETCEQVSPQVSDFEKKEFTDKNPNLHMFPKWDDVKGDFINDKNELIKYLKVKNQSYFDAELGVKFNFKVGNKSIYSTVDRTIWTLLQELATIASQLGDVVPFDFTDKNGKRQIVEMTAEELVNFKLEIFKCYNDFRQLKNSIDTEIEGGLIVDENIIFEKYKGVENGK